MVPTGEVQGGEVLVPHQCIQGLLDPGEWVGITNSLLVQSPVVDTEPKTAVLPHQDHRSCVGTVALHNDSLGQESLGVFLHLLELVWRYAPVGLRDWGVIAGGDAVLHCLSIPKIEVILGKTVGILIKQGLQPGPLVVSAVKCRAGNSIRGCRLCDGGFHGDGNLVAGRRNLHTLSLSMPSTACNTATGVRLARM